MFLHVRTLKLLFLYLYVLVFVRSFDGSLKQTAIL